VSLWQACRQCAACQTSHQHAPLEADAKLVIGPHLGRADPFAPMSRSRAFGRVAGLYQCLPNRAVSPYVAIPSPCRSSPALEERSCPRGESLLAWPWLPLRRPTLFSPRAYKVAGFIQRLRHRLFHECVLAESSCPSRRNRMTVILRADGESVDRLSISSNILLNSFVLSSRLGQRAGSRGVLVVQYRQSHYIVPSYHIFQSLVPFPPTPTQGTDFSLAERLLRGAIPPRVHNRRR